MIIRQLFRQQGRTLLRSSPLSIRTRPLSTTTTHIDPVAPPAVPGQDIINVATEQPKDRVEVPGEAETEAETIEEWKRPLQTNQKFNKLGSVITQAYHPESLVRNPPRAQDVTLEDLLAAQTHLGHATALWNPRNSSYIFGVRQGIHVISLDVTATHLRRAAKVVEEVARRGGLLLFVGTRKGQRRMVVRAAELAKGCHIFDRWVPGSLTNGQQILGHCELKVVDAQDNEMPQFNQYMQNRPVMKPDLVICLNPMENEVLLHECGLNNIPTIGIIDTDADPSRVTYQIPANDDSLRSVALIAGALGRAGEEGQKKRLEQSASGNLPYTPVTMEQIKAE
ncbi:ribosomal protein S2 [Polytolypa hystricis UAMH7299]|uniref:Ribosomal protein S2 n=1 Tax=Polytolypa hystricis (strain UAMH7299) TaxID=1447883 RepID=A0A2B7Z374_POLH7|nr:ribosomal protein S2 [Polytolypa hystricis UAMH7299]